MHSVTLELELKHWSPERDASSAILQLIAEYSSDVIALVRPDMTFSYNHNERCDNGSSEAAGMGVAFRGGGRGLKHVRNRPDGRFCHADASQSDDEGNDPAGGLPVLRPAPLD